MYSEVSVEPCGTLTSPEKLPKYFFQEDFWGLISAAQAIQYELEQNVLWTDPVHNRVPSGWVQHYEQPFDNQDNCKALIVQPYNVALSTTTKRWVYVEKFIRRQSSLS